jgi:antitoxin component of MazEF toxin-antitoxin module
MTHADLAVEVLREAIQQSQGVNPAFKAAMSDAVRLTMAERRIKQLELTIGDFCKFVVDSGSQIGMSRDFHRNFADLCESVGFDADEYDQSGYDREDV